MRSKLFHHVRVSMESSSDGVEEIDNAEITLHRVFATCLNPEKAWFALNTNLCCTKPSTFCSSATAKLFHEEYALVSFEDLRGKDGVSASSKWFHGSKGLRTDKVHVATAFGLFLGILRLRSLQDCPFMKTQYFESVVSWLNSKAFDFPQSPGTDTPELIRLKSHVLAIENQLSVASREILNLREQLKTLKDEDVEDLPTPPATPSPPKLRALPPKFTTKKNIPNQLTPPSQETPKRLKRARKRRISELKVDENLSPETKRRKIRERVGPVVKKLNSVCQAKGESLGSVLGECCINGGKESAKAREAVRSAFDVMVKEKGARVAFSKLLSEETLNARAQSMRVPDWVLVLLKLKSRI